MNKLNYELLAAVEVLVADCEFSQNKAAEKIGISRREVCSALKTLEQIQNNEAFDKAKFNEAYSLAMSKYQSVFDEKFL